MVDSSRRYILLLLLSFPISFLCPMNYALQPGRELGLSLSSPPWGKHRACQSILPHLDTQLSQQGQCSQPLCPGDKLGLNPSPGCLMLHLPVWLLLVRIQSKGVIYAALGSVSHAGAGRSVCPLHLVPGPCLSPPWGRFRIGGRAHPLSPWTRQCISLIYL